ncbi:AAA family ATPase [Embleya sp. NBC_00896]|uniref:ATP-dependent nuclease n=1 Tax=Embleya sp. NBC_00896 TaxID=2975961 RepID=UPI002F917F3E|nr:ATP-binding protein [Embleya sp. NBC_00896]
MKLTGARITKYRSVEDSQQFSIEPDVTALVGKNESGKTTVLQALFRVNPVEESAVLDEVIDFPARLTRERRKLPADERIPVVSATFRLDEDEIRKVEDDLGEGVLRSPDFTVTIGFRKPGRTFSFDSNEASVVAHLRGPLDLGTGQASVVNGATTVKELLAALDSLEDPPAAARELADRLREWRDQSLNCHLIDEYVWPRMPKFVYFADYDIMPGKVSVPSIIRRRDANTLERGEQALLSLLKVANVSLEDFLLTDRHERLVRELENTGNVISDEVFEYWSQNQELAVELEVLPVEDGAQPPLNEAPILQVRVKNLRHRASVPFDDRSRGFVWFFSFLAYFNELEAAEDNNLVLLLDEPGLSLHGRAQEDLLRLIDERLAPDHQVLYTTHSPFMVSPRHFHRVRTVIDHDKVGTRVSEEIFKADEDTAFPLLTAMGIEMTQTLFIGEDTLLLEGPSDLIYLDVLTELLESQGSTGLDPRWVKTPIGGAGKLSTFVTLLGANRLNVAVLVDSSTKDVGAIQRLRDNGQLGKNGLVQVSEATGSADADIEDLFDRDFYVELVNGSYSQQLAQPITESDLNGKDPRIVRQIEAFFKQNNIAGGKFNHYRPAAYLLREQATVLDRIDNATATRAEQLFKRINALLS